MRQSIKLLMKELFLMSTINFNKPFIKIGPLSLLKPEHANFRNTGNIILASWHSNKSPTWKWSIYAIKWDLSYYKTRFQIRNGFSDIRIPIPYLCVIRFSSQPSHLCRLDFQPEQKPSEDVPLSSYTKPNH